MASESEAGDAEKAAALAEQQKLDGFRVVAQNAAQLAEVFEGEGFSREEAIALLQGYVEACYTPRPADPMALMEALKGAGLVQDAPEM